MSKKPTVLMILDGYGLNEKTTGNAVAEAKKFGIDESMTANYHCDTVGTALNYEVIGEAITKVRNCEAPLSGDWKKRIDDDYRKRGGKNRIQQGVENQRIICDNLRR